MSKYGVLVPLVGSVYVEVDADSEEEAIENAIQADLTIKFESEDVYLEEFELVDKVVEGNICYAPLYEAEVLYQAEVEEHYED